MLPLMLLVIVLFSLPAWSQGASQPLRLAWHPGSYGYLYEVESQIQWGRRTQAASFRGTLLIHVAEADDRLQFSVGFEDILMAVDGEPIRGAPQRVPPLTFALDRAAGIVDLGGEALQSADSRSLRTVLDAINQHAPRSTFFEHTAAPGQSWRVRDPEDPTNYIRFARGPQSADANVATIAFRYIGGAPEVSGGSPEVAHLSGIARVTFEAAHGSMRIDMARERLISATTSGEKTIRLVTPGTGAPQSLRFATLQTMTLME